MPASYTVKFGFGYGWFLGEDEGVEPLDFTTKSLDALIPDSFAQDVGNTFGLTYAYRGGIVYRTDNKQPMKVVGGTIDLPQNKTCYIQRSLQGAVSYNLTGWTDGSVPMAIVTTNNFEILSVQDYRPINSSYPNLVKSVFGRIDDVTANFADYYAGLIQIGATPTDLMINYPSANDVRTVLDLMDTRITQALNKHLHANEVIVDDISTLNFLSNLYYQHSNDRVTDAQQAFFILSQELLEAINNSGVISFNARKGNVIPSFGDYVADQVAFAPPLGMASNNTQSAIEELWNKVNTDSSVAKIAYFDGAYAANSTFGAIDTPTHIVSGNIATYNAINKTLVINRTGLYEYIVTIDGDTETSCEMKAAMLPLGLDWADTDGFVLDSNKDGTTGDEPSSTLVSTMSFNVGDQIRLSSLSSGTGRIRGTLKYLGYMLASGMPVILNEDIYERNPASTTLTKKYVLVAINLTGSGYTWDVIAPNGNEITIDGTYNQLLNIDYPDTNVNWTCTLQLKQNGTVIVSKNINVYYVAGATSVLHVTNSDPSVYQFSTSQSEPYPIQLILTHDNVGVAPYTWDYIAGSTNFPGTISITGNTLNTSLTTAQINAMPVGGWTLTPRVTDSTGGTPLVASKTLMIQSTLSNITIPVITTATTPITVTRLSNSTSYSLQFAVAGTNGTTWALDHSVYGDGNITKVSNTNATVTDSIPASSIAITRNYVVTYNDGIGHYATPKQFTVTINPVAGGTGTYVTDTTVAPTVYGVLNGLTITNPSTFDPATTVARGNRTIPTSMTLTKSNGVGPFNWSYLLKTPTTSSNTSSFAITHTSVDTLSFNVIAPITSGANIADINNDYQSYPVNLVLHDAGMGIIRTGSLLTGSINPTSGTGLDGDFYINTANGNVYYRSAGIWNQTLTVPSGAGGSSSGGNDFGNSSTTYTLGLAGYVNGMTILTGAVDPNAGVGSNGNMYVNTSTGNYFLKEGGSWRLISNVSGYTRIDTIYPKVKYLGMGVSNNSGEFTANVEWNTIPSSGNPFVLNGVDYAHQPIDLYLTGWSLDPASNSNNYTVTITSSDLPSSSISHASGANYKLYGSITDATPGREYTLSVRVVDANTGLTYNGPIKVISNPVPFNYVSVAPYVPSDKIKVEAGISTPTTRPIGFSGYGSTIIVEATGVNPLAISGSSTSNAHLQATVSGGNLNLVGLVQNPVVPVNITVTDALNRTATHTINVEVCPALVISDISASYTEPYASTTKTIALIGTGGLTDSSDQTHYTWGIDTNISYTNYPGPGGSATIVNGNQLSLILVPGTTHVRVTLNNSVNNHTVYRDLVYQYTQG